MNRSNLVKRNLSLSNHVLHPAYKYICKEKSSTSLKYISTDARMLSKYCNGECVLLTSTFLLELLFEKKNLYN